MSDWPYFPEVSEYMDPSFMERLIQVRQEFGKPMPVTSHLRTRANEIAKGRSGNSVHCLGQAVDVAVRGGGAACIQRGPVQGRLF